MPVCREVKRWVSPMNSCSFIRVEGQDDQEAQQESLETSVL